MTRFHDWEGRLLSFLLSRRHTRFAWGEHDCSLFACDAVRVITGVDIAADFRGTYHSQMSATRVIKEFAGGNLESLAVARGQEAGMEEYLAYEMKLVRRGDVVLVGLPQVKLLALGIVGLDGKAYCAGEIGYVKYPSSYWLRAWKVG